MNLSNIKYILEVEKCGSISKAASNLYIGQPNLSKIIKDLEAELNFSLFIRTSKGVTPTIEGKKFLIHAKRIWNQVEELYQIYRPDVTNQLCLKVSVPCTSYTTYAFTNFIKSYADYPHISISCQETNASDAISNILEHNYDIGIIRCHSYYESYYKSLLHLKELNYKLLYEADYMLLMSKDHPLARYDVVPYERLKNYLEVIHGDTAQPNMSKIFPFPDMTSETSENCIYINGRECQFDILNRITNTYMWSAPLPKETIARYQLVQKICDSGQKRFKDFLIYPKSHNLTQVEQSFLNEIRQMAKEISN